MSLETMFLAEDQVITFVSFRNDYDVAMCCGEGRPFDIWGLSWRVKVMNVCQHSCS
jgi:hypothetical protein